MDSTKLEAVKKLGDLRRTSEVPAGCFALGHFHNGYYESEFVSPWTKSAQNVDAKLMVVLQDWCGSEYLSKAIRPVVRELGHDPRFPTNTNLIKLLGVAGLELFDVFGTNAFPYIKAGKMNSRLELETLRMCIQRFVIPQIEIIRPKVAVLFGKTVYNSVCDVLGFSKALSLDQAIATPLRLGSINLVASVHTGSKIHIHRGWDRAAKDWNQIGTMLS